MKFKLFTVEGRGEFPLDMLRYDSCYPRFVEDVTKMRGNERRSIAMVTQSQFAPTAGRWKSFGWKVVEK